MKTFGQKAFSFLGVSARGNYIQISLVCLTFLTSSIHVVAGIISNTDLDDANPVGPTNNYISLARVSGFVRAFDNSGLVLESNGVYFPRIALRELSESELRQLFGNKTAYAALTTFGNTANRTSESIGYEDQMWHIWNIGKSLQDKVAVRLEIIKRLRSYNDSVDNINRANYESKKAGDAAMTMFESFFPDMCRSADGLPDVGKGVANYYQYVEADPTSSIAKLEKKSGQAKRMAEEERRKAFNQKKLLSQLEFKISVVSPSPDFGVPEPKIVIDPATGLPMDVSKQDADSDDGQTTLIKIPPLHMNAEIDSEKVSNADSSASIPVSSDSIIQTNEASSFDDKLVKFLIKFADEGYDGPQYQLGVRYLEGKGVPKDKAKGIEYLKKSAAQQNEEAMRMLRGLGLK